MRASFKENTGFFWTIFPLIFAIFLFSNCTNKENTNVNFDPILEQYLIICNQDSLTYIYENFTDNIYIPIKIVVKGDTIKARMRIRGDSSRKEAKKSLKVKFVLNGSSKTLNFNAEFSDKSYIRQYLSSQIIRSSRQNCYHSNFANIYINGAFFGLYLMVENMDSRFLKNNLMSEKGNLYKATKDGACMSIFDDLENDWEKKSGRTEDRDDLKKLILDVNSISDSLYFNFIKSNFNYSQFVNMLALNIYLANASTYYHNYYLYHSPNGKWELLPWDMDKTLSYYEWMPYQYHRTSSEWESDNPLIERAFLNTQILDDIKVRLKEISQTICEKTQIFSLIDKLEVLLENSIEKDTTDQISDLKDWKKFLEKEKGFFENRYKKLQEQFVLWPSTFAVKRIEEKVCDEILFEWSPSKSSRDRAISYILSISSDFLFQDSTKLITKTTSDTSFLFSEELSRGKYYWKVRATDGEFFVDGFNSKNVFEKLNCTILPSSISKNTTLQKTGSPYLINQTITIKKGVELTIEKGVKIKIDTGVNILVHGNLIAKGTKDEPIVFCPKQKTKEWGYFHFFNGIGNFNYSHILEGRINSGSANLSIKNSSINIKEKKLVYGTNRDPIIWTHYGSFLFENSIMDGKGTGEGINTNFSKSIVRNSTFINLPDAIEFICVDEGLIENCIVKNSPDDAIDMNACHNIVIRNNTLINNSDKGISVGKEQYGHSSNIFIKNNTIIGNKEGIAIKDSSFAVLRNNKFYKNVKGISLYRKDTTSIGGHADIYNNIFYKNYSAINIDRFSKAKIGTNISDSILPFGETEINKHLADSINY